MAGDSYGKECEGNSLKSGFEGRGQSPPNSFCSCRSTVRKQLRDHDGVASIGWSRVLSRVRLGSLPHKTAALFEQQSGRATPNTGMWQNEAAGEMGRLFRARRYCHFILIFLYRLARPSERVFDQVSQVGYLLLRESSSGHPKSPKRNCRMELPHEIAMNASASGERTTIALSTVERHFTVAELSKRWFFSENTIRRLFSGEPGVVRIARPRTRTKRGYTSIRIPERIAERVHRRLQGLT